MIINFKRWNILGFKAPIIMCPLSVTHSVHRYYPSAFVEIHVNVLLPSTRFLV